MATVTIAYVALHHRGPVAEPRLPDAPRPLATSVPAPGPVPSAPVQAPRPLPLPRILTPGDEAATARRGDGHFAFDVVVNGKPALMLFDTGASFVTIRAEEAARLGLLIDGLRYSVKVITANGPALVAATQLRTLAVGTITQYDVPAFVAPPGTLRENLLGQSFLKNLRQVTVENNRVILRAN